MRAIAEPPRLKNVWIVQARAPRQVGTGWISDVHLGTRTSNAAALLEFLRDYEFEHAAAPARPTSEIAIHL